MSKHIALLAGGLSSEREVSLSSAKGVEKALKKLGYRVSFVDVGRDLPEKLSAIKPDVAFIALHGTYGEDGCVQGLLEIMNIPYTHSGVTASAIAINKKYCNMLLCSIGIKCAESLLLPIEDIMQNKIPMAKPFVIKPVDEGSSVGIYIINENADIPSSSNLTKFRHMMVEEYIAGKELSVACTDEKALGVIELTPKHGFYDYEHKYTDGVTEHKMPADVPGDIYNMAMENAYKAHKFLGCRGISRSDFRYNDKTNELYFLEINTHPGLTPLSLAPEIAAHSGMNFEQLVQYLVEGAKCQK